MNAPFEARFLFLKMGDCMDTSQHSPKILAKRCQETVDMAMRYIDSGIVIVKTHTPIFSESGRVGCTCESFKRSDKYRQWCEENGKLFDPNYECPSPGKHPAGAWKNETVGVTADQAHDTWGRFHTATDVDTGKRVKIVWNIGTLTGPSNLLTLDADTYKQHYQCDLSDLVDLDDQETPQALTHSGGMHLVFDRQGKPYTNANGELRNAGIDGVDIRGEGGFQVLAPSVGPSGNAYAWVEGYEPWNVERRPIPDALDAILASTVAKRRKSSGSAVKFTTPTTARPNLSQWRVSKNTLDLIHNPAPNGQRSEADYSVCLSLCYAGASDDDILSVFEHYPIGTEGKFAERGRHYLALTIANARGYVSENPRPEVDTIIAHYRRLVEFADWSEIVPLERQSAIGYLTGPTDRKLFANLLSIMERANRVENVGVSYRRLITRVDSNGGKVALTSVQTAKNFLDRINGILIDYSPDTDTDGRVLGQLVSLRPVVNGLDTPNNTPIMCNGVSKPLTTGVFPTHLADDAFAIGTARWAREVIDAEKRRLMAENPAYAEAAIAYKSALVSKPASVAEMRRLIGAAALETYRELMARAAADFLPGLGTFGLLVIADLLENPGSDRREIAQRRGLKPSAVSGVLRKMEAWELVEVDQATTFGARKHYTLVGDVFGEIDAKLPEAKTYKIGVQRLDSRLQNAQHWAAREAQQARENGDDEGLRLAEKRVDRIAQQRFETVPVLYPELEDSEIARFIYTPGYLAMPSKPEAPRPEAPGSVAHLRLSELAGRSDLLTKLEFFELVALNDMLGGGLHFEDSILLADYHRGQSDIQALVELTRQMPYEDDDIEYLMDAAGL